MTRDEALWPPGFGRHGRASVIPGCDDCDRQCARPGLRSLAQQESGARELPPRALAEPDVSLSTHPAPIIQPFGFALSTGLLPTSVGPGIKLDDAAPSLRLHYRAFITTTGDPVPVPRIGTLTLGGTSPLSFSLCIDTTGSHVPCTRLDQGHATFMPDAIWTVSRPPSRLIPGHPIVPGFDIIYSLSTRHQWFTRVRLPGPHLTRVPLPFPSTLTTRALYPRSLRRFGTCSCKPVPRGPHSSLAQHRTPYRSLGCAFMAHTGPRTRTSRSDDGKGQWPISGA